MSELVLNGGFETAGGTSLDAANWTRVNSGFAFRAALPGVIAGTASFNVTHSLAFDLSETEGSGYQDIAVTPGNTYSVLAWVKRYSGADTGFEIVDGNTGTQIAAIPYTSATDDVQAVSGYYVATSSTLRLTVRNLIHTTSLPTTSWYVDGVSFQEVPHMARHLHTAITSLFSVIGGINGSAGGYYYDLTNKVYAREIDPQLQSPGLPYASILLLKSVQFQPTDGTWVRAIVTPTIIGVVAETENLDATNSGMVAALKFLEDVTRAIMPVSASRWSLASSQIEDVVIDPQPITVGLADQMEYAIVPIDVQITIRFGRADLGPNA